MSKITAAEFTSIKKKITEAERASAEADGAVAEMMKQLKTEFECDSLEEAIDLAESLEEKLGKTEKEFEAKLKEFEEKWSLKLL